MRPRKLTRDQKKLLNKHGFKGIFMWQLLQNLPYSIIVKHRLTGEIKVVEKA